MDEYETSRAMEDMQERIKELEGKLKLSEKDKEGWIETLCQCEEERDDLRDQVRKIKKWAKTTSHGTAAAEIKALLEEN